MEKRLGNLESLLTQLLPGIDIDAVVASPDLAKASLPQASPAESGSAQIASPSRDVSSEPVIPEAVPNSAEGFEWKEEDSSVDVLADGMAALSVEPSGVGYLGTSTRGSIYVEAWLTNIQVQHLASSFFVACLIGRVF